ncbi:MAG: hypothetical protein V4592_02515 [Bacteroidota bacterium]
MPFIALILLPLVIKKRINISYANLIFATNSITNFLNFTELPGKVKRLHQTYQINTIGDAHVYGTLVMLFNNY